MEDLSQYRLKDWTWCEEYALRCGLENYHAYSNRVIAMLDKLNPGMKYDIETAVGKGSKVFFVTLANGDQRRCPDLFVKVVCAYMLQFDDIYWNEDWTQIIRMPQRKWMRPVRKNTTTAAAGA